MDDTSQVKSSGISQQSQGTQEYEARRLPVYDRLGWVPDSGDVDMPRTAPLPSQGSSSVAWKPCYFAAAQHCFKMKHVDEHGRAVTECPAFAEGKCPRPHGKKTCLDVWKYDSDFREVMEHYVQFVKYNHHRVPSKKQLKQAGIVPDWKKPREAKTLGSTMWRQPPDRPRSVDSSCSVNASRAIHPFRDRGSSATD